VPTASLNARCLIQPFSAVCGHGTFGTITVGIESGLITPRAPGRLSIESPTGKWISLIATGALVKELCLTNVPGFLHAEGLTASVEGLGEIAVDIAFDGSF
jgi:4-hydroxyproline epimerase